MISTSCAAILGRSPSSASRTSSPRERQATFCVASRSATSVISNAPCGPSPTLCAGARPARSAPLIWTPRSSSSVRLAKKGGRRWLMTDGQDVSLSSEDHILMDSRAVKALLLAVEMLDTNDQFSIDTWMQHCHRKYHLTKDQCDGFLDDCVVCRYISVAEADKVAELNTRAVNEDMFFLEQMQKANLKKRPRRVVVRTRS